MKDKVLLFGGTTEGRELAKVLKDAGIAHTVSVATEYGKEILLEGGEDSLLVGRKSSDEIENLIKDGKYTIVVDATHPFATLVTSEIKKAADALCVTYLRLSRNTDDPSFSSNDITYADSLEAAIDELKKTEGNILLLTGSKDLKTITDAFGDKQRLYARVLPNEESIKKCNEAGLSGKQIIAMQGPFSKQMNIALIKEIGAKVILTKESGKTGGLYEKLLAASEAKVKAVVIRNPESLNSDMKRYELGDIIEKISELTGKDISASANKALNNENRKRIVIAGIGPGKDSFITKECESALNRADVIFGADSVVSRLSKITVPVIRKYRGEDILRYLEENPEFANPVAVYSGDISLCSGAKAASEFLKNNGYEVERVTGISSVTLFAMKLGLSLEDIRIVPAHGRESNVGGYVSKEEQLIILPSDTEHAAKIAEELLGDAFDIVIGYELGTDDECIYCIKKDNDLSELKNKKKGKCIIYIKNSNAKKAAVVRCLLDDEIIRGKVPMTKEEIRALSMRKLRLTSDAVFVDVGAGTGSISLEAAMTAPGIKVFSIEKNEDAVSLLKENKKKFALSNMEIIEGIAPIALSDISKPTHAFIGGSSGNMREIIDAILSKNENARIVINCVTLETFSELMKITEDIKKKDAEFEIDIIQAQVTRYKTAGSYHLADAQNPVYIVTLQKEKK